jgi:hypothetical protein
MDEEDGVTLRVVGAGVGRTGTTSLRIALKRLLGAPSYHMFEVFKRPEHVPLWHAAARGAMPDWRVLLEGYGAAVDWPASAFWPELAAAFPEALVLLSVRDAESWWRSADATIFPNIQRKPPADPPFMADWHAMVLDVMATRFTAELADREAAVAAFEAHNARVRASIPEERLLEWQPGDGWEPLCERLGVAVPDEPFPRANTRTEFLERLGP